MSTHTAYTAHTPHLTLFYKEAKTYNLFSHILTPHSTAPYKKAKTYNLFSIVACSCAEHDRMRATCTWKKWGKTPMRITGRAKLEPATGGSCHSSLYGPSYCSFSREKKVNQFYTLFKSINTSAFAFAVKWRIPNLTYKCKAWIVDFGKFF